jgi:Holliday junction DNA helicase RuvA
MIDYIIGKLVKKQPTYLVLESHGIGYFMNISLHTFSNLPAQGTETLKVLTYLSIKEDAHTLYGFIEEVERTLFTHLISVSGIGPGTGRMILSSMNPHEIGQAISEGNISALQKIKGIGAKSAQRIILEIQDKIKKETYTLSNFIPSNNTIKDEALQALVILGFVKNLAQKAIDKVLETHGSESLALDKLIKLALKQL